MYQQICNMLKQNNIGFIDIAWTDEFEQLQLNDNESFTEYVFDERDKGINFFKNEKWVYYKINSQLGLFQNMVFILEKEGNE